MVRITDIVKYLLRNKEEEINISQVARDLKMDYKNTHNLIKQLEKKGAVTLKKFGKSIKILLTNRYLPIIFEAEHERRNELFRNKNFKILAEDIRQRLNTEFYVLILFGSYAKGTNTKSSDIDLMFIVPNELEESYENILQNFVHLYPLKLHPLIFKEKDFLAMKNSKIPTVGSEAIANNIILHGIESYYGLMQND